MMPTTQPEIRTIEIFVGKMLGLLAVAIARIPPSNALSAADDLSRHLEEGIDDLWDLIDNANLDPNRVEAFADYLGVALRMIEEQLSKLRAKAATDRKILN